jgi:proline dehydrogenase
MHGFNKLVVSVLPYIPEKLVWIFSKRYIAGKLLEDAMNVSKSFNSEGIKVTLDLLGEFQSEREKIEYYKQQYLKTIDEAINEKIDCSFSLKPTMFGLLIDTELCFETIREITEKAANAGYFVRIDMEDSKCTDLEIELFRYLKKEFPGYVGIVLQACMRRTLDDLKNMNDLNSKEYPLNIRLCKGIYNEPEEIAFKNKQEVNENYLIDLEYMLQQGYYPAIATHDKLLVEGAYKLFEKYNTSNEKHEFQMLYGVTPKLRSKIVSKGNTMRIYVPYGKDWFNYSTRRLQENPKMAFDIIKALFIRK